MKACGNCGRVKVQDDFPRDRSKADGRHSVCRDCKSLYDADYRGRNHEKLAAAKKAERLADPQRVYARVRRHEKRYPEKDKARRDFHHALEAGRVIKPTECERCGARPRPYDLHGHHADYSKPLEVEWLCRDCHEAEHHKSSIHPTKGTP